MAGLVALMALLMAPSTLRAQFAIEADQPDPMDLVRVEQEPAQTQAFMTMLENALWIGDGMTRTKPIYVICVLMAPDCRQAYADTREIARDVHFRWLPVTWLDKPRPENLALIAALGTVRDPEILRDVMLSGRRVPPMPDRPEARAAVQYNATVGQLTADYVSRVLETPLTMPVFVYRSAAGVEVMMGYAPDALSALVERVAADPTAAYLRPRASSLILARPPLVDVTTVSVKLRDPAIARLYPLEEALAVYDLPKDTVLQVLAVTTDRKWIQVQPDPSRARVYIFAPRIAEAIMDQQRADR